MPSPTSNNSTTYHLDGLAIDEMSGVDLPAHLRPGWLVMKSVSPGSPHPIHSTAQEAPMEINKEALDPTIRAYLDEVEAERDEAVAKAAETDTLTEQVTSLTAERDEALAKAEEAQTLLDSGDEDAINKAALDAMDPVVRKQYEALTERVQKAEERAAAEEDARLNAEFTKAAASYNHLALDPDTFGPVLRKCAAALGENITDLTDVLKAADEAVEMAGLMEEKGTTRTITGSAYEKLTTLAKAIRETDPSLTPEAAFTKAVEQNTDLYDQYLQEA